MPYRILVVEDEADTREVLIILLGRDAHLVDTAESGPEAVELLARRSYDVILTNLHMPGMSGEELYRRIEQDWPHLTSRVVFVTAARPDTQFRARFGGRPVPILTKPYSTDRLRQVIEEVVTHDV